jgi:hypothetical protein
VSSSETKVAGLQENQKTRPLILGKSSNSGRSVGSREDLQLPSDRAEENI